MVIKKIFAIGLTVCLLGLLLMSACTQQVTPPSPTAQTPAATGPRTGGVLKVSMAADGVSLGWPATQGAIYDIIGSGSSIETLMRVDAKGTLIPWLAERWTSDTSAKTITLYLKKGVKFHDGTDFNAAAVKWNLEQFSAAGRAEIPKNLKYEIVDDYTLKIILATWDTTVLNGIGWYAGYMISPTAWQKAPGATTDKERNEWCQANPVGTGPFQFVTWQKSVKQVYKKFPGYWQKGKPYLDGVEWIIIVDPLTASASFQNKEVDALWYIPPDVAKTLKSGGFTITELKSGLGSAFKALMPYSAPESPFAKLQMRQALGYAIDAPALANAIYSGYAFPIQQYSVPTSAWANPDYKGFTYDPAKAKQLVAEAGYPSGIKTKMATENDATNVALATAIQGMLAKANINVEIEPMTVPKHLEITRTSSFDSIDIGHVRLDPEPTTQFMRFVYSKGNRYQKQILHPEETDKLILASQTAPDDAAQKKAVWELQRATFEKYCLFVPMICLSGMAAKQPYLKGDGLAEFKLDLWTPEDAWLNK